MALAAVRTMVVTPAAADQSQNHRRSRRGFRDFRTASLAGATRAAEVREAVMIEHLRPLTQEQRQGSYKSAREAVLRVIGPKPVREHFAGETISRYPVSVTRLITFLCLILLLAAFTPSAIRLYVIGSQTFGQVVFSLALATLGASRSSRRLLYSSMAITTCLALTGNVQVGLVGHTGSPFAWLEAMAPPIVVLSTAYVLKEQLLEATEHRHATERTCQMALNEWHKATAHPENYPKWSQFHANALRDMLSKTNNRRQETLAALTTADWRALVYRELQTEQWYTTPGEDYIPTRMVQEMEPVPLSVLSKRNGNGVHASAGAV